MTSGKFILGESARKDACVRFLLVLILLGVVTVAVLVGCYAFNSVDEYFEGCKPPVLDPYGLSNFSRGSDRVAFGCFPGHQMEGHDEVLISHCIDKIWVPPPPACAALPISLECAVDQNGIKGTISMWQMSNSTPTLIHGFLSTSEVDKGQPVLFETIELSRNACRSTSENITSTMPKASAPLEENQLEVRFNTTKLLAYKKAQLRVTRVFIDVPSNLTATVVSVHQGQETLVMKLPMLQPSPGWSYSDCNKQKETIAPVVVDESEGGVEQQVEELGVQQPVGEVIHSADSVEASSALDETETVPVENEAEPAGPETRSMKRQQDYPQESNYNSENYPNRQDSY